jgi:ribosome biogenesis protein Tsr3
VTGHEFGGPLARHDYAGELSTGQAHAVMQRHRECDTGECTTRRTARAALVKAGRMALDTSRPAGRGY